MPLVFKKYLFLLFFLSGVGVPFVFGQDSIPTYNPFELQERLPPEEKVEKPLEEKQPDILKDKKDTVKKIVGNPFDLPETTDASVEKATSKSGPNEAGKKEIIPWTPDIPDFGKDKTISDFWIGIYILLLGVILAVLNTLFSANVKKTFRAFASLNMFNLSFRQLGDNVPNYAVLLHLFYILCGSLFLFLLANHFNFAGLGYTLNTFALALGFLILVTVLRHLLLAAAGAIFPFGKEINLYRHSINIFDYVLGFLLFPLVIFIAFAPPDISRAAIFFSIGLVLLIYIFRSLRGLVIGRNYFSLHKFHFFLYLCTVEIAPLLVTVKLLTIWGSAV